MPSRSSLFLCLLFLSACGPDRDEAVVILEEAQSDDYRGTYARAPEWETPLLPAAGGPHGDYIDLYLNEIAADAVQAGNLSEFPIGSLIIKDGFDDADGEELVFISLMEKRENGEWFWAEYGSSGNVKFAGLDKPTCVNCHERGNDQVLAFELP